MGRKGKIVCGAPPQTALVTLVGEFENRQKHSVPWTFSREAWTYVTAPRRKGVGNHSVTVASTRRFCMGFDTQGGAYPPNSIIGHGTWNGNRSLPSCCGWFFFAVVQTGATLRQNKDKDC